MKKNDFAQVKGMNIPELRVKVKDIKVEIADLVLDKNMKKMKDLKTISKKRKDLAQTLTVIRQKELLSELEDKQKKEVMDNSILEPKVKKGAKK